jgi:hypothetical protein
MRGHATLHLGSIPSPAACFRRRTPGLSSPMLTLEYLEPRCLLSRLPPSLFAFDYSRDTSGLFANTQRRQAVELAGIALSARVRPHLEAIVPDATHHWTGYAANPSTGERMLLEDLTVLADKIVVYVGARDMHDAALASETPAPAVSLTEGDLDWQQTVHFRGAKSVVGTPSFHPDPYGPWGGTLAFSTTVAWDDGASVSTPSRTPAGYLPGTGPSLDLFGTAEHELGHLLGFGTAPSWAFQTAGNAFTGPHAEAVYGGPVPVDPGGAHWVAGTQYQGQHACMDFESWQGRRFTELDYAALVDMGWNVTGVP